MKRLLLTLVLPLALLGGCPALTGCSTMVKLGAVDAQVHSIPEGVAGATLKTDEVVFTGFVDPFTGIELYGKRLLGVIASILGPPAPTEG